MQLQKRPNQQHLPLMQRHQQNQLRLQNLLRKSQAAGYLQLKAPKPVRTATNKKGSPGCLFYCLQSQTIFLEYISRMPLKIRIAPITLRSVTESPPARP